MQLATKNCVGIWRGWGTETPKSNSFIPLLKCVCACLHVVTDMCRCLRVWDQRQPQPSSSGMPSMFTETAYCNCFEISNCLNWPAESQKFSYVCFLSLAPGSQAYTITLNIVTSILGTKFWSL